MTNQTIFFKKHLKQLLEDSINIVEWNNGNKKFIEFDFGSGRKGKAYFEEEGDEITNFHVSLFTDETLLNEFEESDPR